MLSNGDGYAPSRRVRPRGRAPTERWPPHRRLLAPRGSTARAGRTRGVVCDAAAARGWRLAEAAWLSSDRMLRASSRAIRRESERAGTRPRPSSRPNVSALSEPDVTYRQSLGPQRASRSRRTERWRFARIDGRDWRRYAHLRDWVRQGLMSSMTRSRRNPADRLVSRGPLRIFEQTSGRPSRRRQRGPARGWGAVGRDLEQVRGDFARPIRPRADASQDVCA